MSSISSLNHPILYSINLLQIPPFAINSSGSAVSADIESFLSPEWLMESKSSQLKSGLTFVSQGAICPSPLASNGQEGKSCASGLPIDFAPVVR
jgi:hypothetical protein